MLDDTYLPLDVFGHVAREADAGLLTACREFAESSPDPTSWREYAAWLEHAVALLGRVLEQDERKVGYEFSARLVKRAGVIAVQLGRPDLMAACEVRRDGCVWTDEAIGTLGQCLWAARDAESERDYRAEPIIVQPRRLPAESRGDLTGEQKALALLVKHPEWSNAQIAKEVGCQRTSLYRWPRFVKARKAMQGELPQGSKDGETGRIEAWD